MSEKLTKQIAGFIDLLTHHRGEKAGSYDDVGAGYDLFAPTWDHVVNAKTMVHYEKVLKERIPEGGVVLDAGAGTGERTLAILRNSSPAKVIALDASEKMLQVAKRKIDDDRVEFRTGNITNLPFEDNTFDVVSCTWVLSILDNPRQAATEFLRVLKPGGTVVYAFCSLPEGTAGKVASWIAQHVIPNANPLSHLLTGDEQPYHDCDMSTRETFAGGLTTVVTLGKCCTVSAADLPCLLSPPSEEYATKNEESPSN